MKRLQGMMVVSAFALFGGLAATDAATGQDFDLPTINAPQVPDVPVPEPTPVCVSCPGDFHCNDEGTGCEANDPPPTPAPDPAPAPQPDPDPAPIQEPEPVTTDVPS